MNQNQEFENKYIRHTCTSAFQSMYLRKKMKRTKIDDTILVEVL